MRSIKVVTVDASAYYDVVSRLKATHLRFSSVSPGGLVDPARDLVLTSKREVRTYRDGAVAIEDLSRNPIVMEGQLLSRLLEESKRGLLIGIDPGSRIGMVIFFGGRELGALTENTVEGVVDFLATLVRDISHSSLSIKIGGGQPKSALRLAELLRARLQGASIEIVDESGTSAGRRGTIGATRDERAAVRIAFRRGVRFQ